MLSEIEDNVYLSFVMWEESFKLFSGSWNNLPDFLVRSFGVLEDNTHAPVTTEQPCKGMSCGAALNLRTQWKGNELTDDLPRPVAR